MTHERIVEIVPDPHIAAPAHCRARVNSREFGWGPCYNAPKGERLGLALCGVHLKMADRFLKWGVDYAKAIIRREWDVVL